MSNDNVIKLIQPGAFDDQLTEVLRTGARALLAQAVEAEVAEFLGQHADLKTSDGRSRVVRHGHLPEREVMTGIGPVGVRQPRVRDREAAADDPGRIRFTPALLPPYVRRSKSLEALIPLLYLKGVSTGDFEEALAALLGNDAPGLSASTIARLKEVWVDEHKRWNERDLSAKRYVYMWADGIHLQARLEEDAQCLLVIIGATPVAIATVSAFLGRDRIGALHWIGAIVSTAGIYFVVGRGASFGGATLRGDLLVMISVACWTTYTLGAARLLKRHSPLYVTGTTMAIGAVPYVLLALPQIVRMNWAAVSAWTWTALVLSAFLALCLSYLIWYMAVQRIGPARTSIYSNLVPIVAILTRGMARRQREAARALELQAWHLRQLVPTSDEPSRGKTT